MNYASGSPWSLRGYLARRTAGGDGSAVAIVLARRRPANHVNHRWHLMVVDISVVEVVVPATVIGWLWLAWANSRGQQTARIAPAGH
jgi:hypothetical protein